MNRIQSFRDSTGYSGTYSGWDWVDEHILEYRIVDRGAGPRGRVTVEQQGGYAVCSRGSPGKVHEGGDIPE